MENGNGGKWNSGNDGKWNGRIWKYWKMEFGNSNRGKRTIGNSNGGKWMDPKERYIQ